MADLIDRQEVLNVIFNIMTNKKIKHKHRALNRNIKQLKIVNKRDGLVRHNDDDYIDDYVMKMTIITRYIMCPKCDDIITLKEKGREWD